MSIWIPLAVFSILVTSEARAMTSQSDVRAAIEAQYKLQAEAYSTHKADAYLSTLAPDFAYERGGVRLSRKVFEQKLRGSFAATPFVAPCQIHIVKFRFPGTNAEVTAKTTLSWTVDQHPALSDNFLSEDTWTLNAGAWKMSSMRYSRDANNDHVKKVRNGQNRQPLRMQVSTPDPSGNMVKKWITIPAPVVFQGNGLEHVREYATRLVQSKAKNPSLIISTLDRHCSCLFVKTDGHVEAMEGVELAPLHRVELDREQRIRHAYERLGLAAAEDTVHDYNGVTNSMRDLVYRLPNDPAVVTRIVRSVLVDVYHVRRGEGLSFLFGSRTERSDCGGAGTSWRELVHLYEGPIDSLGWAQTGEQECGRVMWSGYFVPREYTGNCWVWRLV